MALTITDADVEQLATQVAEMAQESETEAIRIALQERAEKLQAKKAKHERVTEILERFWQKVPPEVLGKSITKEEEEEILGFGPDGV